MFIPGFAGAGKSFASLNWAYKTVPQENFGGRAVGVAAGKALGGGTVSKLILSVEWILVYLSRLQSTA